jgi:hypothetical protein
MVRTQMPNVSRKRQDIYVYFLKRLSIAADNGQLYLWAPAFEDAQDQTASVPKPFHGFTHSIETVAIGEENFVSVGYRHTAAALDCSPFIPFAVL